MSKVDSFFLKRNSIYILIPLYKKVIKVFYKDLTIRYKKAYKIKINL